MVSELRRAAPLGLLTIAVACAVACAQEGLRRFPLQDPLWTDPDSNPIAVTPGRRRTSGYSLPAEQLVLRPVSRALTLPLPRESLNVNSVDEVPNSSWFTNRIGFFPLTPEEVGRGACGDAPPLDPSRGPWTITSGKTDGTTKGFVIQAPDRRRYLLKFDGPLSQRATTADVVGSKIYHAAGYHTPCNEVVYFDPSLLVLAPMATRKGPYGEDVPMTAADEADILLTAWRRPDGLLRASTSRYLEGAPLGPFRFEGVRADDPKDVVPHDRRRELRASMLFAAWIHHWDAIENNTLDTLVDGGGGRFVRHHFLDWSDSLGALTWSSERVTQRVGIGRTGYLQWSQLVVDLVTLGLYPRPWYHLATPPQAESFGYFGTEHFVASKWRPTYMNPAFAELTSRDALWAARIIARFTDAHLAAIVRQARLDDPEQARFLTETLIRRRDLILREYLGGSLSALDRFSLHRAAPGGPQALCFEDLAVASGVADPATTVYRVHVHAGSRLERLLGARQLRPATAAGRPARSCFELPLAAGRPYQPASAQAPADDPLRYGVVEIYSNQHPALRPTATVVIHLYDLGPERGLRIVGIERPEQVPDQP
jgi:hypothetical protein